MQPNPILTEIRATRDRLAGIVTNDRPKLYGIAPPQYQVPGQPALDLGVCLLRLDRLPSP